MKVYIIQNKYTMVIHGCFKTKIKAMNFVNYSVDYEIIECEIA